MGYSFVVLAISLRPLRNSAPLRKPYPVPAIGPGPIFQTRLFGHVLLLFQFALSHC